MAEVSTEKQRKKRKLNFTVSEINILTSKVEENLDIIQSKFTNSVTNQRKNKLWDNITKEVNAIGVASRTTHEVKEKWKNLKALPRKGFQVVLHQKNPLRWKKKILNSLKTLLFLQALTVLNHVSEV